MEHAEILHRCFRCGYCKLTSDYQNINCPAYLKYRFETFSPGGRMWLLRAWLNGEVQPSPRFQQILYSCAACGNCVEHCAFPRFKAELLDAFIAGREELVKDGKVPGLVQDYLKSIQLYGNPYKLPEAERAAWAEGLGVEPYDGQEYLFFAGCVGAYDERGRKMARAAARVLQAAGVSFGILGAEERSDGNETRVLGERMLFEVLAAYNIEKFKEKGVRKVIVLSPHAYHAMRNHYPALGGDFEVFHYSQVLAGPLRKVKLAKPEKPWKVAFHDPCYLGRHNGEYQAPRQVLKALPGIKFRELERREADALCCGGGGGNFFTDLLGGGPDSPARVRAREAAETGAEVLAVACPQCLKMFEDAVKAEDLEESLKVMDIAEIAATRLAVS